ncbi:hypothetical protein A2Z00_00465 [Candidatus Gottesmanbacteria bacterium RBG_13_45_10]|uniref:Glycoside hydrolase family 5 domain-containing protein n=1 Tax=Candidatus Gottesmanbacteria bacterium RBG_13_45_10 TaxID=1798370 RepID=A0A1F5ZG69_9BACT|nr:MAG: hypothetical protein A2Z00_00465 [Candidatus Gottesmanbacteria bacterium RBG_13_45_10]
MKRLIIISIVLIVFLLALLLKRNVTSTTDKATWWAFQSVDTMKYSRDASREKLNDPSFDQTIDTQVKNIADTGATHVAIATPYDEEFVPILKRWVAAARKYHLNVWFRGNWSGWEKWFGYTGISREEHITKTRDFILNHPGVFEDGDIFSGCPECENGGPGNPQITGDVRGYRKFLIDEYQVTKDAFIQIGKRVASNYFSMNGDVAKLIMDKPTTLALDGIVTIDHYVASPDRLVLDIRALAAQSGGRVVLGEFGAPILDIHGPMDEEAQARYLNETFRKLVSVDQLIGINYWVSVGGSTKLWNDDGNPRKAVSVITEYFTPRVITGHVINQFRKPIANAEVSSVYRNVKTAIDGNFNLPIIEGDAAITIHVNGYTDKELVINKNDLNIKIVMEKPYQNIIYMILDYIKSLFTKSP